MTDSVLAVGAPNLTQQDGGVYVFRWNGSAWLHDEKLIPAPGDDGDHLGRSVAVRDDDSLILAGAAHDDGAGTDAGAVYAYRYDGAAWLPGIRFVSADTAAGDNFGISVASRADIAMIGAHDGGRAGDGVVYEFGGLLFVDCNENAEPDTCDILSGSSADANGDGIPDECAADVNGDGTDPEVSESEKGNMLCWMDHYMNHCTPSCGYSPCNGADPFGNPCGGH